MCAYDPTETYKKISFRNIPHQVRLQKIEKVLKKEIKNRKINSLIDMGCASGFITQKLKDELKVSTVYGTDALEEYIKNATDKYPDITFELMDLNKSNTSSKKFDLVTCFETLEHVGRLDTALENIYQSINPNGFALISVPIETGMIGIIKYLLKTKVYKDGFRELGPENQQNYYRSLIRGRDISVFRNLEKEIWWEHFGFDYRQIEKHFEQKEIQFKGITFFTTRFIVVYKQF